MSVLVAYTVLGVIILSTIGMMIWIWHKDAVETAQAKRTVARLMAAQQPRPLPKWVDVEVIE